MTDVLFNFTNRCNLQCRHCYAGCGPEGETMSMENIEKVLEHIPKDTEIFSISGGEPFMEQKKMMRIIRQINEMQMPHAKVAVLTNGFWLRNEESAYAIIKDLMASGLKCLGITSADRFHLEQGLDASYLNKNIHSIMQRLYDEGVSAMEIRSWGSNAAHPFGRGKSIKKKEQSSASMCSIIHGKGVEPTIVPDGLVYPCCWRVTPSIGSALESPLEELVGNMAKSELFSALLRGGPRRAAQVLSVYRTDDEASYIYNPCAKCEEIFRGIR